MYTAEELRQIIWCILILGATKWFIWMSAAFEMLLILSYPDHYPNMLLTVALPFMFLLDIYQEHLIMNSPLPEQIKGLDDYDDDEL